MPDVDAGLLAAFGLGALFGGFIGAVAVALVVVGRVKLDDPVTGSDWADLDARDAREKAE